MLFTIHHCLHIFTLNSHKITIRRIGFPNKHTILRKLNPCHILKTRFCTNTTITSNTLFIINILSLLTIPFNKRSSFNFLTLNIQNSFSNFSKLLFHNKHTPNTYSSTIYIISNIFLFVNTKHIKNT